VVQGNYCFLPEILFPEKYDRQEAIVPVYRILQYAMNISLFHEASPSHTHVCKLLQCINFLYTA
jgi:hypothetical protein